MEPIRQAYEFLAKGGPVMGILVACSILCMTLIFERMLALRRRKILPRRFLYEVEGLMKEKKVSEALALSRASEVPVARVVATCLSTKDEPVQEGKDELEAVGRREAIGLEKNLNFLGMLAGAGPLIGLLGTVTGMIRTFGVVAITGVGDPLKLSSGIAEALLNTAGGLVVGIPALIAQQYFLHRVDGFVMEMEEYVERIMKLLRKS